MEIATCKGKRGEHKTYADMENHSNLRFCAHHLVHVVSRQGPVVGSISEISRSRNRMTFSDPAILGSRWCSQSDIAGGDRGTHGYLPEC